MSAVACRKRGSSFFEGLPHAVGSPPAAKRARCGAPAYSPPLTSPPPSARTRGAADPALVADIRARFPAMNLELIEKALEESGNDLDTAIKSLVNLHLESVENNGEPSYDSPIQITTVVQVSCDDGSGVGAPTGNITCPENLPLDGSKWVELLVNDIVSSSNMDDAKARASSVLEGFQKAVISGVNVQASHEFQKENSVVKQQLEAVIRENTILKRAFAIQHERQKDYDEKNQELQQLKQLVAQYQEQGRSLEVNNYALRIHLSQAQQGSSIPGHFHPDVF